MLNGLHAFEAGLELESAINSIKRLPEPSCNLHKAKAEPFATTFL